MGYSLLYTCNSSGECVVVYLGDAIILKSGLLDGMILAQDKNLHRAMCKAALVMLDKAYGLISKF